MRWEALLGLHVNMQTRFLKEKMMYAHSTIHSPSPVLTPAGLNKKKPKISYLHLKPNKVAYTQPELMHVKKDTYTMRQLFSESATLSSSATTPNMIRHVRGLGKIDLLRKAKSGS